MRSVFVVVVLAVSTCCAQFSSDQHSLQVTGDAAIRVVPDEVVVLFGVTNRQKDIATAVAHNDSAVKQVIAAVRKLGVDSGDIQTDYFHVSIAYLQNQGTVIDYYEVTKEIQVILKNTAKFEDLLNSGLRAGANRLDGVEFKTTELRRFRDQARTLAAKAAVEKAQALASAAGMEIGKPLSLTSYSYGGGSSYALCCGYGGYYGYGSAYQTQNVVQNAPGRPAEDSQDTVSLGKINVTASVTMTFQIR